MSGAEPGPTIRGSPKRALSILTFGYFVGFAGVVVYGPVASEFENVLGLSGVLLGLLVAAPQLTGSLLRIPFSAWADSVGAKKPFSILLGLSVIGMGGLLGILITTYPDGLTMVHYPLIFFFGALSGCGIAAFSVGITDISYWYESRRRGTMLALFAGLGTLSPGLFTIVSPFASSRSNLQEPTRCGSDSSSLGRRFSSRLPSTRHTSSCAIRVSTRTRRKRAPRTPDRSCSRTAMRSSR